MRPIRYAHRTLALCAGDDVLLAPEIAALEPDRVAPFRGALQLREPRRLRLPPDKGRSG
jgi:hypothetical protein